MKDNSYLMLVILIGIVVILTIYSSHDNFISYSNNNDIEIAHSYNHSYKERNTSDISYINYEKALADEEAEKLRGTGYHNTRPGSSAESIEIEAAKVKCRKCGMHF